MIDYFEIPNFSRLLIPELIHEWNRECILDRTGYRIGKHRTQMQRNVFEMVVTISNGMRCLLRLMYDHFNTSRLIAMKFNSGYKVFNKDSEEFELTRKEADQMHAAFMNYKL